MTVCLVNIRSDNVEAVLSFQHCMTALKEMKVCKYKSNVYIY